LKNALPAFTPVNLHMIVDEQSYLLPTADGRLLKSSLEPLFSVQYLLTSGATYE